MYKRYYAVIIILLLILPVRPSFTAENTSNKQNHATAPASYEKGYRFNIMGWVYIHIEGEPYERGYQYGILASNEILDMIQRWSNLGHDINFMKLFLIKNLPKNYDKLSEQWWKICKSKSMRFTK